MRVYLLYDYGEYGPEFAVVLPNRAMATIEAGLHAYRTHMRSKGGAPNPDVLYLAEEAAAFPEQELDRREFSFGRGYGELALRAVEMVVVPGIDSPLP